VSSARNTGIISAEGDWLALLDSDDSWSTEKIEKQLALYRSSGKNLRLIHTSEIWYKNGKVLNQKKKHSKAGGDIFKECVSLCCISPSSVLIRKDLFSDIGYFDEKLLVCEDYDFWLRVSSQEEVLFVDEPLTFKFGGHLDQLSKKYWGLDRFRVRALEKLLINGKLTKAQVIIVAEALFIRLKILHQGAQKRHNLEIEEIYRDKIIKWQETFSGKI